LRAKLLNLKYDQQTIVPPWAILDVGNRYNYLQPHFFFLIRFELLYLQIETPAKIHRPKYIHVFVWVKSTSEACSIKMSLFQDLLG